MGLTPTPPRDQYLSLIRTCAAALVLLWWLEPKLDAYARERDSAPTD